jgi:DNA ligase-1
MSFGVKNVPESSIDGNGITWERFQEVADKLHQRELTGYAARDAILELMNESMQEEWNWWFRSILLKDLRCGVAEKTVNTVVKKKFPQFTIPVFTVQLAFDNELYTRKMTGPKGVEVKLDGVRFISIVYPCGQTIQYSRNGKEMVNFPNIASQFNTVAEQLDQPYVFDGEIMSKNFQDLMRQVYRKVDVDTRDAKLYLFDMIPLKDFNSGICHIPQHERTQMLKEWYQKFCDYCPNIEILGQEVINLSTPEGKTRFNDLNQIALETGYEGLLIKDLDAPYELKRSTAWLKQKPFITLDLQIIAVEEGTKKYEGKLGAIVCSGVDAGRKILVNCGSGFSDEERIAFWAERDKLIGQIVEIKADAISRDRTGAYSLRFPRFGMFRDDKDLR